MNTISNSQSTIDSLYALKKIQEASALQQTKIGNQKEDAETDSILISQQGLQSNQVILSSNPLESLVSNGTITQDQSDAVQSVFQSRGKEIQSSGTYSNKTRPENPLDSLVSAGTITEEQKSEIQSTLQSVMGANRPPSRGQDDQSSSTRTNPLDSLVSDGTITQTQEDTISTTLQEMMEANRKNRLNRGQEDESESTTSPLNSFVEDGTITKEQLDAIESTLKAEM